MAGISDMIKRGLNILSQGFERNDGDDDIFDEMMNGEDEYPVSDNLALEPIYGSSSASRTQNDLKVVTHPSYRGYEVIVSEPRSYDESISIVKHLKEKKTIILNLHLLDKEQSLRIVDFLCGATHALGGNQQKVSETVFIFTPNSVSLSSETQKKKFITDALWNQPQ